MSIKLNNNERFIVNKTFSAGSPVTAVARVRHNYPEGSEQATLSITGLVAGELDTTETEDNNNQQTLTVSGEATISENVKLQLTGGDNQQEATATINFTSGLELTFTAVGLGAKGNDVVIAFVAGAERGVDVDYGSSQITVTFTYESGDTGNDMYAEFDEVNGLIIPDGGSNSVASRTLLSIAPTTMQSILIFNNELYAAGNDGKLYKFDDVDTLEVVANKLSNYYPKTLFELNGSLYCTARDNNTGYYNHILKYSSGSFSHIINETGILSDLTRDGSVVVLNNKLYLWNWEYIYVWWEGESSWVVEYHIGISSFYPFRRDNFFSSPFSGEDNYLILIPYSYQRSILKWDTYNKICYTINKQTITSAIQYNEKIYMTSNNSNIYEYDGTNITIVIPEVLHAYGQGFVSYAGKLYAYYSTLNEVDFDNSQLVEVSGGFSYSIAVEYNNRIYGLYGDGFYFYQPAYGIELLDDQTEQMTGGFTPELEILQLRFGNENILGAIDTAVSANNLVKLFRVLNGIISTITLTGTIEYYPAYDYRVRHENPLDSVVIDKVDRYHQDKFEVNAIMNTDQYNQLYDMLEDYNHLYLQFVIGDKTRQFAITDILALPSITDSGRQNSSNVSMIFESVYTNSLPFSIDSYQFTASNIIFI
jgi:hypothetical protein